MSISSFLLFKILCYICECSVSSRQTPSVRICFCILWIFYFSVVTISLLSSAAAIKSSLQLYPALAIIS